MLRENIITHCFFTYFILHYSIPWNFQHMHIEVSGYVTCVSFFSQQENATEPNKETSHRLSNKVPPTILLDILALGQQVQLVVGTQSTQPEPQPVSSTPELNRSPTGTTHTHRKLFGEDTLTEKETIVDQNLNAKGIITTTATVQWIHYCSQKKKGYSEARPQPSVIWSCRTITTKPVSKPFDCIRHFSIS
ncbi:uncharacterized protein LOC110433886 isoform X4 [Sorghum bicolor]|uniref:uncharacterized protein LOC110433886 isoform X4 n=1 Tax=Sorghum bicolor TaxID=4558 RepID=UPI000B42481B|nr:uncharacterized protein LOC110433886 isoform X4 [Sorghum bicolor]|eukprot:XP_021312525.1 uncharacterized protein LOC110433886 isoform X4 [Sorghum bicolor]